MQNYEYKPLIQMRQDKTNYRLISKDFVRVEQFAGIGPQGTERCVIGQGPARGRDGSRRGEALQEPASIDHGLDRVVRGRAG